MTVQISLVISSVNRPSRGYVCQQMIMKEKYGRKQASQTEEPEKGDLPYLYWGMEMMQTYRPSQLKSQVISRQSLSVLGFIKLVGCCCPENRFQVKSLLSQRTWVVKFVVVCTENNGPMHSLLSHQNNAYSVCDQQHCIFNPNPRDNDSLLPLENIGL